MLRKTWMNQETYATGGEVKKKKKKKEKKKETRKNKRKKSNGTENTWVQTNKGVLKLQKTISDNGK
ncbi:hypothetical protein K457DRAFT_1079497 [Linnemannia elongata AG-77]|uniref:Uncharacterized protein n=1 Tax=Linnemannia elongata AG-77 TaxID=1314771 RepID=A0A197JG30_9FUNG|nr:hypothetical protein K457DRAFT_1079497 [Linnemannia elongata AG-77]